MGLNSQSVSTIPGKSEILNVNGLISEYNEINNWTKDEDDAKMVKYWVQTVTFKNQYIIDPQGNVSIVASCIIFICLLFD